jgi:hypothetical protein
MIKAALSFHNVKRCSNFGPLVQKWSKLGQPIFVIPTAPVHNTGKKASSGAHLGLTHGHQERCRGQCSKTNRTHQLLCIWPIHGYFFHFVKTPKISFVFVSGSNDEAASTQEVAEKILFFHPSGLTVDEQLQRISLCEGILDFTRYQELWILHVPFCMLVNCCPYASKFSPDQSCNALYMDKSHYTFLECEPSVFMIMVATCFITFIWRWYYFYVFAKFSYVSNRSWTQAR